MKEKKEICDYLFDQINKINPSNVRVSKNVQTDTPIICVTKGSCRTRVQVAFDEDCNMFFVEKIECVGFNIDGSENPEWKDRVIGCILNMVIS